jgi:hypothetical protein
LLYLHHTSEREGGEPHSGSCAAQVEHVFYDLQRYAAAFLLFPLRLGALSPENDEDFQPFASAPATDPRIFAADSLQMQRTFPKTATNGWFVRL